VGSAGSGLFVGVVGGVVGGGAGGGGGGGGVGVGNSFIPRRALPRTVSSFLDHKSGTHQYFQII
jgi:hypothetical protein